MRTAPLLLLLCASLPALGSMAKRVARPNIVFIMSDDQDGNDKQDWADIMPKLKLHFQDGGLRFNSHVADAPQCGPSRSSTLTGRAVHNTKFWINADPTRASFANYAMVQNRTIGTFLTAAGWHTVFLGKYVNGFECVPNPIFEGKQTWSYWHATCNTYVLYNSSYVSNTGELIVATGEYQTDTLGKQAIAQMGAAKSAGKPFYIHITPVAPHASTCYNPGPEAHTPWCEERAGRWFCDKDPAEFIHRGPDSRLDDWANSFTGENEFPFGETYAPPESACGGQPGLPCCKTADATQSVGCPCVREDYCENFTTGIYSHNPHQPQWNKSMAGFPSFLDLLPPIPASEGAPGGSEDVCYRQRLRSVLATDDMIDNLVKALMSMELLDTTYMFYTADVSNMH